MKISRNKNGTYSARIYLGLKNGKRVTKRLTRATSSELKKAIAELQLGYVASDSDSISLSSAFEKFISARSNVLSPATYRNYLEIARSSFGSLMAKNIDDITQEDVQAEINAMASNLTQKTIKNKLALFISVYNTFAKNPKKLRINLPQKTKKETYLPTQDDIENLIHYIREHEQYSDFLIPVMLAAYLGLRKGEILALTYDDIDFRRKLVNISKSKVITADNTFTIKQPKTYAGYRTLTIPDAILAEIKKQRKAGLPLTTASMDRISHTFPRILRNANIHPFRFHDLRHFFASMLLVLHVPDLYAIQLTGHSTTHMLQRVYQHTFKDKEQEYKEIVATKLTTDA